MRIFSAHFVVIAAEGPGVGHHRLGITAGRKIGGAVKRNRIKRLIREYFRTRKREIFPDRMPSGADIVIIARPGSHKLKLEDVAKELDSCLLK